MDIKEINLSKREINDALLLIDIFYLAKKDELNKPLSITNLSKKLGLASANIRFIRVREILRENNISKERINFNSPSSKLFELKDIKKLDNLIRNTKLYKKISKFIKLSSPFKYEV